METRDARRALLARLLDHAPTFPPAALPPAEALAEDARASGSRHAFVLGRLVWPASRLEELPPGVRALSVVLDAPLPWEQEFAAVEAPFGAADLAAVESVVGEIYIELPLDGELEERLDELARRGLRAKVRCGGAAIPREEELARFVRACRARNLVFKATAGLHRAARSNGDHGFLNLLAAAAFAGDEERALAETDRDAFLLDAESFSWRDRTAPAAELARLRRELFHSIGSCSFFEPVEELEALGVLPP
jgi:predicted transcriptional regulator